MRPRRLLTPRGGAALGAALVCVVAAHITGALILLYIGVLFFLLTLLAVVLVHVPRRSGTVARRIDTDLLGVGQESSVTARVDLDSLRPPRGLWVDTLPSAVSGDASGGFPPIDGTLTYTITGRHRGVWPIGPLRLVTTDPFGLAERTQELGEADLVTVVPESVPLSPLPTRIGAAGGATRTATNRLGPGSDDVAPRRYMSGDSMRRIHWRTTAHRGELMVRQEEAESSPDALIILDRSARRWATPGTTPDRSFENAISLCASVARRLEQDGYGVDVIDSNGVRLGALHGHDDARDALLLALARISPRGDARPIPALVHGPAPGPLVLITGTLGRDDADRLRTAGAAAPLLFATTLDTDAAQTAAAHRWLVVALGDDIARSWDQALDLHRNRTDERR